MQDFYNLNIILESIFFEALRILDYFFFFA